MAGDYEIRINGSTVMTPTTGQVATNAVWTDFFLGDTQTNNWRRQPGPATVDFDDLYVIDDQGSHNTSFLGDCRIETLFPNGAGASSQWTPNSGTNYSRVNEVFTDQDTSYVSTAGVGNRDSYAMGDLSSLPATVFGVQVYANARPKPRGRDEPDHVRVGPVGRLVQRRADLRALFARHTSNYAFDHGRSSRLTLRPARPGPTTGVNGMEAGIKLVN